MSNKPIEISGTNIGFSTVTAYRIDAQALYMKHMIALVAIDFDIRLVFMAQPTEFVPVNLY